MTNTKLIIYKELFNGHFRYRYFSVDDQRYYFISEENAFLLRRRGRATIVTLV